MKTLKHPSFFQVAPWIATITCASLLLAAAPFARAALSSSTSALPQDAVQIPADQLDALVAPIALYPDNLLSQTLVASTYPLEIIQLQQWLDKNSSLLKDQKRLADAVKQQPWDPSVQALAAMPDLVNRLADDIQWTTDLGNAFLAQQSNVMDAIQRMRHKAQDKGALQSNQQATVQVQTIESKEVIVIQQANPEVVYVPSYDPVYVYGPAVYPYPSIYYPPYYGGAYAAAAIGWGVGFAMGAFWGGGWGWGCGWGHGDVNVNWNNNFNRNSNFNNFSGNRIGSGNRPTQWQHNPSHRGGAPYADQRTANRFGGTTRGDSLANRQRGARNQIGRQGGNLGSATRPGGVGGRGGANGVANRGGAGIAGNGMGNRGGAGNRGGLGNSGSVSNRGGIGTGGNRGSAGNRGGFGNSGSVSNRGGIGTGGNRGGIGSSNRPSGSFGGGDRVGNRSIPRSSSGGGFGGGFNGARSSAGSSRGSSSMSRGGGGYGGGSRGGGGFGGGGARGGGGGGRRR